MSIKIFADVDYVGFRTYMRSTNGYATYMWENLVNWRSKKQLILARSGAEIELRLLHLEYVEDFGQKEYWRNCIKLLLLQSKYYVTIFLQLTWRRT